MDLFDDNSQPETIEEARWAIRKLREMIKLQNAGIVWSVEQCARLGSVFGEDFLRQVLVVCGGPGGSEARYTRLHELFEQCKRGFGNLIASEFQKLPPPFVIAEKCYAMTMMGEQNETRNIQEKCDPSPECSELFQESQILTGDKLQYQRILNDWFGVPKQIWKIIYRASTDGFSAEAFHRHCDGISPTFVVIMNENGEVCGGFSDVPWGKTNVNRGRYVSSEKAFLFTLINNCGISPTKFDIIKKSFAIAHHSDFGPVFGAGADLSISSDCNLNAESYSNLPHSYGGDNASCTILMGDYNFSVLDYEVFTIIDK